MTESQYDLLQVLDGNWMTAEMIEDDNAPTNWRRVMPSVLRHGWAQEATCNGVPVVWRATPAGRMASFRSKFAGWTPDEVDAILALGTARAFLSRGKWLKVSLSGITDDVLDELVESRCAKVDGDKVCLILGGEDLYRWVTEGV